MIKTPGYRLLVKPEEIKRKTASGLIIEYGENEKLEKRLRRQHSPKNFGIITRINFLEE